MRTKINIFCVSLLSLIQLAANAQNLNSQNINSQKIKIIFDKTISKLQNSHQVSLGGMDGGGGLAVLSQDSIILLDVFEAQKKYVLDMGPGPTFREHLQHVLNRLEKISPAQAFLYGSMANELLTNESEWTQNDEMPVMKDSGIALIPRNSILIPVAIQRPTSQQKLPGFKRYIIDEEVFKLLPETSKAALILHEIIYLESRDFAKRTDSTWARSLVGVLISNELEKYDSMSLWKLYDDNGIRYFRPSAIPILSSSVYNDFKPNLDRYQRLGKKRFWFGSGLVEGEFMMAPGRGPTEIESTNPKSAPRLTFPQIVKPNLLSVDLTKASINHSPELQYLTQYASHTNPLNVIAVSIQRPISSRNLYVGLDPSKPFRNEVYFLTASDKTRLAIWFNIPPEKRKIKLQSGANPVTAIMGGVSYTNVLITELDANGEVQFIMYLDERNRIQTVGQNEFELPRLMFDDSEDLSRAASNRDRSKLNPSDR